MYHSFLISDKDYVLLYSRPTNSKDVISLRSHREDCKLLVPFRSNSSKLMKFLFHGVSIPSCRSPEYPVKTQVLSEGPPLFRISLVSSDLHGRARAAVAEIFKVPTVPDLELTVTLQDCRSTEVSADRWIEW